MNDTGYVRMNGETRKASTECAMQSGAKTEDEKLQLQRRGKIGVDLIFEQ